MGSGRLGSNCHFPAQMANPILITLPLVSKNPILLTNLFSDQEFHSAHGLVESLHICITVELGLGEGRNNEDG